LIRPTIVSRRTRRGEAIEGVPPGEVVGGDEVSEMPNELIVRFVVISFDGRVLDCPVHPLDLSIGPRMIGLGQPMLDPVLMPMRRWRAKFVSRRFRRL
jgi:hypothetical protein